MTNVLVVCHGNINRSALCAAILKRHAGRDISVRSAGFTKDGQRAAKKMRIAAAREGYNLEEHRSTLITQELIKWSDLIVYMDGGNYKRLKEMLNGDMPKTTVACLGQWSLPHRDRIADPNFLKADSPEFNAIVSQIIEASRNLAEELIA